MDLPDWISSLPIGLQYTIAVLVGLSAIGVSVITIIRWVLRWSVFRNLWPTMEDWNAICLPWHEGDPNKDAKELDAERPLRRPNDRWCQMRNMREGDYYFIDMQKDRVITRMHLVTHGRDPKEYEIEIFKDDDIEKPISLGKFSNRPMDIKLQRPTKFRKVKFTIITPDILPNNAMHSWCIYEIRFWEARLLLKRPTWRIKVRK